ncbi:uncharacterized protein DS421_13g427550 [Arachis hypogaea]|nr:uncharacterized protein DS421_13g427550 [Arachis hypogaea]
MHKEGECSKLDLDNVDECEHKEGASSNRASAGDEHASAEGGAVDASGDELNGGGVVDGEVVVVVTGKADGLLEGEGDEAGEEEGAERVDVEGDEILGDGGGGRAGWIGVEVVRGVVGVPREADEDGEGEEGVHVHDSVQCCNVEPRERRRRHCVLFLRRDLSKRVVVGTPQCLCPFHSFFSKSKVC